MINNDYQISSPSSSAVAKVQMRSELPTPSMYRSQPFPGPRLSHRGKCFQDRMFCHSETQQWVRRGTVQGNECVAHMFAFLRFLPNIVASRK